MIARHAGLEIATQPTKKSDSQDSFILHLVLALTNFLTRPPIAPVRDGEPTNADGVGVLRSSRPLQEKISGNIKS